MVRVPSVNGNSFDPDYPGEDSGGINAPDSPAPAPTSGAGLPFFDPGNSFADFGFEAIGPTGAPAGGGFEVNTDGLADDNIFAGDPAFDLLRGDMAAASDMFSGALIHVANATDRANASTQPESAFMPVDIPWCLGTRAMGLSLGQEHN